MLAQVSCRVWGSGRRVTKVVGVTPGILPRLLGQGEHEDGVAGARVPLFGRQVGREQARPARTAERTAGPEGDVLDAAIARRLLKPPVLGQK